MVLLCTLTFILIASHLNFFLFFFGIDMIGIIQILRDIQRTRVLTNYDLYHRMMTMIPNVSKIEVGIAHGVSNLFKNMLHKLESFSHTEMDRPELKMETSIVRKNTNRTRFFWRI